jgi:hypothetical protein
MFWKYSKYEDEQRIASFQLIWNMDINIEYSHQDFIESDNFLNKESLRNGHCL